MKLLFTILIIYLGYKFFFQPPQIDYTNKNDRINSKNKHSQNDEEYTDYEEVE